MQFQLITPEKVFFSGEAEEVNVPGEDGDFGVLIGHAPTISTLKAGVVVIRTTDGNTHKVATLGGVAEAIPERCSVLAEVARSLDGVSKEQLQKELNEAESKVNATASDDDKRMAEENISLINAALASL